MYPGGLINDFWAYISQAYKFRSYSFQRLWPHRLVQRHQIKDVGSFKVNMQCLQNVWFSWTVFIWWSNIRMAKNNHTFLAKSCSSFRWWWQCSCQLTYSWLYCSKIHVDDIIVNLLWLPILQHRHWELIPCEHMFATGHALWSGARKSLHISVSLV